MGARLIKQTNNCLPRKAIILRGKKMATAQKGQGYDRGSTVFSPEGKIFQVQYAQEAVKKGLTALGAKTDEGVVLAAERKKTNKLVEEGSVEKVFQIDEHVGVAAAGLIADARVLIDQARIKAQTNRLRYDEVVSVESLAEDIGNIKQEYTQKGGVRPYGTKFLIGGVGETGPHLFETDPSGAIAEYNAHAIGGGAEKARDVFENNYRKDMKVKELIQLNLKALDEVIDGELNASKVELAQTEADRQVFEKLSEETITESINSFEG